MKHNEPEYKWYETFGEVIEITAGKNDLAELRNHHVKAHKYDDDRWLLFVTPKVYYPMSQDRKEEIKSWPGIKRVLCVRPSRFREKETVTWSETADMPAIQLTVQ